MQAHPDTTGAAGRPGENRSVPLRQLASVIRSKNAGPYEITLDVLFDREETYRAAKATGVLGTATIARLYGIPESDVLVSIWVDAALGYKATIKRPWSQGAPGEKDVFGAQQHGPLMLLELPADGDHA